MKVKSLLAAILGLALALSALTGVAGAGKPDDPGKSEDAPGQVKKAEEAPPATPASQGKSAQAPGQTKTEKAAEPAKGKSAEAKARVAAKRAAKATAKTAVKPQQEPNLGRSAEAHHHIIICHATGSATNPFVVINIPMTAWTEAHDVHQDGRDFILKDPASRPGSKDGFDKSDCVQPAQPAKEVEQQPPPQEQAVVVPPAAQQEQGGVLGAQAVVRQPPAQQGQGGVLGEVGAVAAQELPFTGLQLWIALLAALGLVAAGLGVRRATR